jgi:hypothetical protein
MYKKPKSNMYAKLKRDMYAKLKKYVFTIKKNMYDKKKYMYEKQNKKCLKKMQMSLLCHRSKYSSTEIVYSSN